MAFGPLSPYSIPYRLNPNLQGFHPTPYDRPLNAKPVRLGPDNCFLNATGIPINQDVICGLKDNEPVPIEGRWQIPRTGYPSVDIPLNKMSGIVECLPYATADAVSSSLQWGSIGAVSGFCLTAAGLLLLKSTKLLAECSRTLKLALPFMWGASIGITSGILGFSASFCRNFYNYRLHMRKNKLEKKRQSGPKGI